MLKKFCLPLIAGTALLIVSCNDNNAPATGNQTGTEVKATGQSGIQDNQSAKNVVQVAISSKDHSTLVTAVKAADLVDALSNAGPFTVFAPTNEAFNLLPAGTVDALLKPEKKADLVDLLQYHVSVGVFKAESLQDGQTIGEVNGDNIKITRKDGKIMINGTATIIASIPASNGIIHIIDRVLITPAK